MKKTRSIVNESAKKKMGRPRSVSENGLAPAVAVRLPLEILAEIDRMAANSGKKRSDVIRELVTAAVEPASASKPTKAAKASAPRRSRQPRA
jgi:Arc/MetJ-type ribon-helix-helix transcriptional regulator